MTVYLPVRHRHCPSHTAHVVLSVDYFEIMTYW